MSEATGSLAAPARTKSCAVTIGTPFFSITATVNPFFNFFSCTAGTLTDFAGPGSGICANVKLARSARETKIRNPQSAI